jgi:ribonuclease R
VTKRDLARAFKLKGQERAELRAMIRDLQGDGLIVRGPKRRVRDRGRLPGVAVVEVVAIDDDGELVAEPVATAASGESGRPRIHLTSPGRGRAPEIGDHVLARLIPIDALSYDGQVIKVLPKAPTRVVGVLEQTREGLFVRPIDRGAGREFRLSREQTGDAKPGELVAVENVDGRGLDNGAVKVTRRLGHADDAGAVSLLAAYHNDLRTEFPAEVLAAAELAEPAALQRRADLRTLPLVTIDGGDARDFDDAVFAQPDDHPGNPGGWRITVAIADVAHYVRHNGPLDAEARERGNSSADCGVLLNVSL